MRRIERAARLARRRGHQRLERAPEHLRVDRRVRHQRIGLARREPVVREQPSDHLGDRVVGESQVAVPSLQWAPREQSTIEEGHASERPCGGRALGDRRVERAEEQRLEQADVQAAPSGESLHVMAKECAVAIEPSFGLEECEEE